MKSTVDNQKLVFVVQKHKATTLHYDFRLEIGGVETVSKKREQMLLIHSNTSYHSACTKLRWQEHDEDLRLFLRESALDALTIFQSSRRNMSERRRH